MVGATTRPYHFFLKKYMNQKILKIATKKFNQLSKKYDGFINVIVDDWRGFRFIFDAVDVKNCKNDCANCNLFKLLVNEKGGIFSSNLYPASLGDKIFFGPQRFFNCKTLKQYQNCYANFLINKCWTEKEIKSELRLIKNTKIIYSKEVKASFLEEKFKKGIIKKVLSLVDLRRRKIIANFKF